MLNRRCKTKKALPLNLAKTCHYTVRLVAYLLLFSTPGPFCFLYNLFGTDVLLAKCNMLVY